MVSMGEKIRILFLSANPTTTGRIRVDEEARTIFERLESSPKQDTFDLVKYPAVRLGDIQRLLVKHRPQIVHFSGHGSRKGRIILEGVAGRSRQVKAGELVDVFRGFTDYMRIIVLNACFSKAQAMALAEVIDYSIGIDGAHGDRAAIVFSGTFYAALATHMSVRQAFEAAKAELKMRNIRRSKGFELFIRAGVDLTDPFLPRHCYIFNQNVFVSYHHDIRNCVDRFANGITARSSSVTISPRK